ncbi:hypothetical protein, partial [Corallococcus sp. AS-1-6]|uniref:hypothetical protein n=1 Tax=Corallococcus sp. AS-1-6 TaxID=2874599 RepID=UPI001CBD6870
GLVSVVLTGDRYVAFLVSTPSVTTSLRRALEEGQQAQAKGDKVAMEAARLRATTAVQSLSPEEQALVGQLILTFMPNNEG